MNHRVTVVLFCVIGVWTCHTHAGNSADSSRSLPSGASPSASSGSSGSTQLRNKSLEQRWVSAIANDRASLISDLLSPDVADNLIPLRSSNGKSALMVACKSGDLSLARRLVAEGADVNAQTATGGTPFMFAVLGDHLAIARWLFVQSVTIDVRGSNGWTAMTIAAAKGQSAMLGWLISIGADANVSDVYQFTPLMRAVDNGHILSVQVLIDSGQVNLDARDESGNTGLHHATANGDLPMVQLLLDAGANAEQANRQGVTPADVARSSNASRQLLALLSRQ